MNKTLISSRRAALLLLAALLVSLSSVVVASAHEAERSPLIIESMRCEGNASTSCRFILSYVYLAVGDQVNEEQIQDAKLRLTWLGKFSSVDIRLEKGSARGKVVVVIEVTEARTFVAAAAAGTTWINNSTSVAYSGRVSDYDVFGTGKLLNFDVDTRVPSTGRTQSDFYSRLQYVDPQFLVSRRYFLDADFSYREAHYQFTDFENFDERMLSVGGEVGRRLGEFSYVALGYEHRPVAYVLCNITVRAGSSFLNFPRVGRIHNTLTGAFGWNADDPTFPTGGSALNVRYARDVSGCGDVAAEFRYTFDVGHGYLTLNAQYPWGVGAVYARDLALAGAVQEVRRARWYVQPGVWSFGYSTDQQLVQGIGIRAGMRLETKTLGIVDLFVYGGANTRRGSNP